MKKASPRYSPELRERAVRMVLEHQGDHGSQWAAIASIAGKVGCTPESLRRWVRQAERDRGLRSGPTPLRQDGCRPDKIHAWGQRTTRWLDTDKHSRTRR